MNDHPVPRMLAGIYDPSGPLNIVNGTVCVPENECFCKDWLESRGSDIEALIANILQWFAFGLSVVILCWYAYQTWRATCGWEEVYVCCIELTKVIIEFFQFDDPSMLYLANGNRVQWLRYGEWLLTCPVILIHLSNITGLKDDYSKRTMRLLVSDIGTIVWGATSAMAVGYVKVVFFLLGCLYGANTFFHAAKVYIESYHTVPEGHCRIIVRLMAWVFFLSWAMFPILFVLGPEGFGHLTVYGSTIGHTIIDILSKNVWGFLGHHLRVKIHEHILLHGDIRKKTKIKVAGEEMEVETLMAEEDEDTVKKPTAEYANRESFLIMRDRLKDKGFDVRASLDESAAAPGAQDKQAAAMGGKGKGMEMGAMGGAAIDSGRVILAVPDISMVDFFREQFAMLPVPYELVPALGVDNTVALVQQAAALGGCDFVLVHPEFLRDKSAGGVVNKMRMLGVRVAAFGWAPLGPMRDLIEGAGLDGWVEGPSFGAGINQTNLVALISRMQNAKKMAMMNGMGMMGGMGGMGMGGMGMGGLNTMNSMGGGMGMGMGMNPMSPTAMAASSASPMMQGQMSSGMSGMNSMQTAASARIGTNPLFGSAPSPLNSQPGGMASPGTGAMTPPAAAPAGGNASEAEMLSQLMAEINRLKSELGDQH